jgi:hypothetical protein
LGETKVGFIEKSGLNTYIIDPADAMVQISNLERQSGLAGVCVSLLGMTWEGLPIPFEHDLGGNYQLLK